MKIIIFILSILVGGFIAEAIREARMYCLIDNIKDKILKNMNR